METYYPLLYLLGSFLVAVLAATIAYRLKNLMSDFENNLTGIWVNESQTIRILLHHIDSVFQGEVVWVNSVNQNNRMLGARMIKDLALRRLVQGSSGIYIDPDSGVELPFRLWFQGKGRLKFAVIDKIEGKDMVVKEEKWFQL